MKALSLRLSRMRSPRTLSTAPIRERDRVATLYGKVGTVQNGDRVEVLEKQRRFVRVKTDKGQEGWIEERSLVPQEVYDGFQQLAKDSSSIPVRSLSVSAAACPMCSSMASG